MKLQLLRNLGKAQLLLALLSTMAMAGTESPWRVGVAWRLVTDAP